MPGNEPIKLTQTFICIRRKPVAYAVAIFICVFTLGIILELSQRPNDWRVNVYGHLEDIRGEQMRTQEVCKITNSKLLNEINIINNKISILGEDLYGKDGHLNSTGTN